MGNLIPIAQVREDVADAFRKEVELQESEKLLPYKTMCSRRQVRVTSYVPEILEGTTFWLIMLIFSKLNAGSSRGCSN